MAEASLMDQISTAELLGRIDERTRNTGAAVQRIDLKIDEFTKRLAAVENEISNLQPAKKVVYGLVALVLIAFATAFISLVIVSPKLIQQQRNDPPQQQER